MSLLQSSVYFIRGIMSDATDLYIKDMKITKLLFRIYGIDLFSASDSKIKFGLYLVVGDLFLLNSSQIYSSFYFWGDISKVIFSAMTWPFGILVGIGFSL